MKFIKASRHGPRDSKKPIVISWQEDNGRIRHEEYSFTRGSVVWPHEDVPGIALMAGRELASDRVVVLEEASFKSLSEAVDVFERLWGYVPSCWYHSGLPEHEGFLHHLQRRGRLSGKLPFIPAPHADAEDYGHGLIREYLSKNLLTVCPHGLLARQLQEAKQESNSEQVYAVTALRYLLAGIADKPWPFKVTDLDLASCVA